MTPIEPAKDSVLCQYFEFAMRKSSRGAMDIYAAFQPFNEATRALQALFPSIIQQNPQKILVLWDRTGYLANLLQSILPNADVEVTWDTENDVLGRTGYAVWMAGVKGPRPWLCDHTESLPFPDNHFDLIVALDVLHRVSWPDFLNEMDRVLTPQGAAIFPHIHLANAQPDPFFERGGTYRLGLEYQQGFDNHPSGRKGWLQSEPALFRASFQAEHRMISEPNHPDYNGLAAWTPAHWLDEDGGITVGSWSPHDLLACRGFLNPLVKFNLAQGEIEIDPAHRHGFVKYMFDRHPVYEHYLRPSHGLTLSDVQVRLLHFLEIGKSLGEFKDRFGIQIEALQEAVSPLVQTGALFLAPFSEQAHAMQTFVGTNKLRLSDEQCNIRHLMAMRVAHLPNRTLLRDDEDLGVGDVVDLVEIFTSRLLQDGVGPGDHVVCQLPPSWMTCLLSWSVMGMGAIIVPFEPGMPLPANLPDSKLVFSSLDKLEEWLESWDEQERSVPPPLGNACAVLLHTSGTTGAPKGVPLTHRQLIESAMAMTSHYELDETSVLMMHSSIDTMSGFRNSLVLPWVCGGGLAICPIEKPFVPDQMLSLAKARKANVIAANPTMFRMLLAAREPHPRWQTALCTGAPLSADIKSQWLETTGIPLLNYYGLTETTGFCIAERIDVQGGIGVDVLGVSQIHDGQLRLFSDMIAQHYITPSGTLPVTDTNGWYWTGDDAERSENGTITLLGRGTRRYKTSRSALVRLDDLEAELALHPDVQDAHSVVAQHHEAETAKVFLKLARPTPLHEIQSWLEERWGKDKTPLFWFAVPDIPRNAAGKVEAKFKQP